MLKKEFHDTLKVLFHSSVVFISIPLIGVLSLFFESNLSFLEVLTVSWIGTVGIFAIYSGLALFQSENKDRGFEYLLSLPISKSKLLLYKIFPRIFILLTLFIISYIFIINSYQHTTLGMNPKEVFHILIFLFGSHLGALFFSLAFNSIIIGFAIFVLMGFIFGLLNMLLIYFSIKLKILYQSFFGSNSGIFAAILLLIPLGISFFLTFKNLDFKPLKYRIKPYLFIAYPLILVQVVIILIFFKKVVTMY